MAILGIPDWLYGANAVVLELLAMLASFSISYFGYKAHKILSQKRFFYLGLAFFFIGISFLARTIVHILFYIFGAKELLIEVLQNINYGSLFYMILTLVGYLIIVAVITELFDRRTVPLLFLISLAGILFSQAPTQLFHIISLILLFFIMWRQLLNYAKNKNMNALLIFITFLLLSGGHVLFMSRLYLGTPYMIYILAHLFQLFGYLALLLAMIRVWAR